MIILLMLCNISIISVYISFGILWQFLSLLKSILDKYLIIITYLLKVVFKLSLINITLVLTLTPSSRTVT